jgi:23S rRNA pseudouridine2605 synthase
VGEVFAQVVSGTFDVEADVPEGSEPPKRVLPPDPDAPKLHKVLAQAGIGSRRDMEELILDGQITVNGEPAHIGQRISFGDQVKVGGKPVRLRIVPPPPRILAYHKPVGEIVTLTIRNTGRRCFVACPGCRQVAISQTARHQHRGPAAVRNSGGLVIS